MAQCNASHLGLHQYEDQALLASGDDQKLSRLNKKTNGFGVGYIYWWKLVRMYEREVGVEDELD